jgi:hypothetical protein
MYCQPHLVYASSYACRRSRPRRQFLVVTSQRFRDHNAPVPAMAIFGERPVNYWKTLTGARTVISASQARLALADEQPEAFIRMLQKARDQSDVQEKDVVALSEY